MTKGEIAESFCLFFILNYCLVFGLNTMLEYYLGESIMDFPTAIILIILLAGKGVLGVYLRRR